MRIDLKHPFILLVLRFLIGGGIATAIYYTFLIPCTELLGWKYWPSAILAFVPSLAIGFQLSRTWIFDCADPLTRRRQLFWFTLKQVAIFIAGLGLVDMTATYFQIWYLPLQFGYTVIVTAVSFLIAWKWIFIHRPPHLS